MTQVIVVSTTHLNNQRVQRLAAESSTETTMPPLIVVGGPTATGKTGLAIELALAFGGEVVNADSRYFYRGMNIGVAKPSMQERRGVPHHLIDLLEPSQEMSLALYQEQALAAIGEITKSGRLPIMTGGTPLYVNAVVEGWIMPRVPPDPVFRERLTAVAEEQGVECLSERLRQVDPAAATRCGRNPRRIIRALEVYEATGQPMTAQEGRCPPPYRILEIALAMPRQQLYELIDQRVDRQIATGLVDEVKCLLATGLPPGSPAFSALGYRQLLPFLAGEQSLAEAIQRIKFDTHRYVRQQETWLRRNPRKITLDATQPDRVEQARVIVAAFLDRGQV